MVYDGKWEMMKENDEDKICRVEGQVWIGLREILLNPKCAPYYEITEFRMSQLVKVIIIPSITLPCAKLGITIYISAAKILARICTGSNISVD